MELQALMDEADHEFKPGAGQYLQCNVGNLNNLLQAASLTGQWLHILRMRTNGPDALRTGLRRPNHWT